MRKIVSPIMVMLAFMFSCGDDDINLFDKTADERAAEAIAGLKQELVAPSNGWIVKYRPQEGAGSYYVLLDFNSDDHVIIKSDLGAEGGTYFEDTISYRVDNSMGLELILENYSFFHFLFEQDQATFGAEYEFNFVNKTPDNALVFTSKTDTGQPDIVLFQEASPTDEDLLGIALAGNLNTVSGDLDKFTSSITLTYTNKDLAFYLSLDAFRRTITVTSASLKSNTATSELLSFSTGYLIEGDSIKFDEPLFGVILGNNVSIRSIRLNDLSESSISVCPNPITIHGISGVTSGGDPVVLETSLMDLSGSSFVQLTDLYYAPPQNIFNNGASMFDQVPQDIPGAQLMQLYYDYDIGDGSSFYALGFFILNPDETTTFLLREFTPVIDDNNIVFNFAADVSVFGNANSPANTPAILNNVNTYLDALSGGGSTYVFKIQEHVYEFFNPCTGWTFVFVNPDQ